VILITALVLMVVSIVVIENDMVPVYRFCRGVVNLTFFLLLLTIHGKRTSVLLSVFFILYGLSSILTLWYEINFFAILSMGINAVSFGSLCLYLLPKISFEGFKTRLLVVFVLLVAINAYLLYQLIFIAKASALSTTHYGFMLLSTTIAIVLFFLSILFNHLRSTKASFVFLIAVVAIIFSEVFRAIAYYELAYEGFAVYMARALLIFSTGLFVHYSVLNEADKKERVFKYL